ncbi:MAG: DUF2911 domain-containing protein [Flavobacteriaceae bacterium]|nr:DUF2911 domain-containing protein [Flavobacteriaceae bacterium]
MKKSTIIKIAIAVYTILLFSIEHNAQSFKNLDECPQDITYYRESRGMPPLVKVIYGRPTLKKEKAFGFQVPFNKVWRTGANEATEITFFQDVIFGNQLVKVGTYVLVTIPGEKEWEVILNKNLDVWGAFQYDPKADIVKIKVPVNKAERLEVFSIAFKRIIHNEIQMVLGWDSTRVKIPLKIKDNIVVAKL